MGRVARAGGSDSGRSGERTKNIGKPRTKRRKRKDLEELHRNVLEAKRNLRIQAPQKKKRKAALRKVLKNFADKRQENEDKNHGFAEKKGRNINTRTICDRLLPEPILGIYQNGTKGREVHRVNREFDKINAARLEGDVLKLLNGDETNSKLSWNCGEKQAQNGKGSKAFPSDESDYASSVGDRVNAIVLSDDTKGVKRINEEKKETNFVEEDTPALAKNEQQQFLQRDNKCKRRLFEPNEDRTGSNHIGNVRARLDFLMDEIRFSPPRSIARNVSPPGDGFRKKQRVESTEVETRKKIDEKLMPIDANFWGWSPTIYYERLCAMICADNFENNRREQPRGPDPVAKIRRTLREFYRNDCRYRRPDRNTVLAEGNKRQEQTPSKVSFPLVDSSFPSTTEIQACTADSELEQESSDSDATKVGTWRSRRFGGIFNPKDSSVLFDTNKTTVESKRHNKISQLDNDKPVVAHEQSPLCEKSIDGVEKTINSVSLFLEKLRENNPSNGKGNIFEVEMASTRFSGQKEHLVDYSVENPHRDLTFDMNLKTVVRRNTKHVPTILRRSNSRCGLVERADEKQRLLPPSNDWPINIQERTTRTIAALPRWSSPNPDDFDDLQTPSVVNHFAVLNKAKGNILKSKLNFIRAKYRPDARSLSSEYQGLQKSEEKHDQHIAKEIKVSANKVFVNAASMDNREWYRTDFVPRDQERAKERKTDRREEEYEKRRVNFDEKRGTRDFKESSLGPFETGSPKGVSKYQLPPASHNYPGYHTETASSFSSFEFACPDIPKNSDTHNRHIFASEMENFISQRLEENSEETSIRPRYLSQDLNTSLSTRVSRLSNAGPSAFRFVNEIKFPPKEYVERIPMCSDSKDQLKNRSCKPLPNYDEDTLPFDRLPNETAECSQHCQGVVLRQRIRKPVMLFRPIQEMRQQQEVRDSRYRLPENGEEPIYDAVRNLGVVTFKENTGNQSSSKRQVSHDTGMYHLCYQPQQQQQSLSQPRRHPQLVDNRQGHSQEFDTRPVKYLAFDEADGRNPRRLPIYVKAGSNQDVNAASEVETSKLFNIFPKPENKEMTCMMCRDVDDPRQHATRVRRCGQQQQLQELGPRRASQVTLMVPYPAPLCQGASTNFPATTTPTIAPTSIKDIPRVVYSMTSCETLVPAEMTYQLEPPLCAQSRYDNESLSKRVHLPDGRVGILVTKNCSIDNPEHPDNSGGPTLSFKRIDTGNSNDRNHSSLANRRIYY